MKLHRQQCHHQSQDHLSLDRRVQYGTPIPASGGLHPVVLRACLQCMVAGPGRHREQRSDPCGWKRFRQDGDVFRQ